VTVAVWSDLVPGRQATMLASHVPDHFLDAFLAWIIRDVTTGDEAAHVVMVAPPSRRKARIIADGANGKLVHPLDQPLSLARQAESLRQALLQARTGLLVIDPLDAFMDVSSVRERKKVIPDLEFMAVTIDAPVLFVMRPHPDNRLLAGSRHVHSATTLMGADEESGQLFAIHWRGRGRGYVGGFLSGDEIPVFVPRVAVPS
jgi:hypothetical protein